MFYWKLRLCTFMFRYPRVNRANILARLKLRKLLKNWKMHFHLQNRKLARLSSICIGCPNGPRNRREQPIFDLGLSWFALITLKTGSRPHLRKNQLGRWNVKGYRPFWSQKWKLELDFDLTSNNEFVKYEVDFSFRWKLRCNFFE